MPNITTPEARDVEGFGLAAIETTALGGRLLASRLDGITDAVIDGSTATFVEPGNIDEWVRATMQALALPHSETAALRARAREATRQGYSRSKQAEAFRRLIAAE